MTILKFAAVVALTAVTSTAQPATPALRIEAVDAGSVMYVTNRATQPMTAFLIEMLNYPGTSFYQLNDDLPEPVAPGVERKIPITNMTIGAAPEYVKITAAIFADGATAGDAPKIALLLERRRAVLETTRELVKRLSAPGAEKGALTADLRKWWESIRPSGRAAETALVPAARRNTIEGAINRLGARTVADVIEELRRAETRLAATKPAI